MSHHGFVRVGAAAPIVRVADCVFNVQQIHGLLTRAEKDGLAVVVFLIAGFVGDWIVATSSGDQISALFGSFSIGTLGYTGIVAQVVLIAAVTAATSREVVNRTLKTVE